MNTVPLTNSSEVAYVSSQDYDRVAALTWNLWGPYPCSKVGPLHHFIIGERPVDVPQTWVRDHINRVKRDATRSNLRWVSPSFNNWNKDSRTANKFRGVSWITSKNKWRANFCGKSQGYFAEERQAAIAVAIAAVKEWPEWAWTSDLLFGMGLLQQSEVRDQMAHSQPVKTARSLPVGVCAVGTKFRACYGKQHLGMFLSIEEAAACHTRHCSQLNKQAWEEHLKTPISRDVDGDAVINLRVEQSKVPEELWHALTFQHSWNYDKPYAKGTWNGRSIRLHVLIYTLLHPGYMSSQGSSVDHINCDQPLNNLDNNLRIASRELQAHNAKKKKGCSSQYKGVSKGYKGWRATCKRKGVYRQSSHTTEMEARAAAVRMHAEMYSEL